MNARYILTIAVVATALVAVLVAAFSNSEERSTPAATMGGAPRQANSGPVGDALPPPLESLEESAAAVSTGASPDIGRVDAEATGAERFIVRVLDEEKQPVAGAVIYGDGLNRESIRELGHTDAYGRAALAREHFPASKQSLFAVAPGERFTRNSYSNESLAWPGPVVLQIPPPPDDPGCFGRVVRAVDGVPVSGASVALYPTPRVRTDGGFGGAFSRGLAPARTGPEGQFKLPFISPHSSVEILVASAPGFAPTQIRWSEAASFQEQQQPLEVALKPLVRRRGSVRFDDGAPARGVTVGIRTSFAPFGWEVSTQTDQDGRFELSTSPEEVSIEAFFHAYVSDSDRAPAVDSGDGADRITLELPCSSRTRLLLDAPPGLDRSDLSLFVEDDFGFNEYPADEDSVPVYVPTTTEARLMLAAKGSRLFESFIPVASAENIVLHGDVTQTVKLTRPPSGTLEIELGPDLRQRLGAPEEIHVLAIEPGARPYARTIPMQESKLRIQEVPAQPLRISVGFRDSLESPMRSIDLAPEQVISVLFQR